MLVQEYMMKVSIECLDRKRRPSGKDARRARGARMLDVEHVGRTFEDQRRECETAKNERGPAGARSRVTTSSAVEIVIQSP